VRPGNNPDGLFWRKGQVPFLPKNFKDFKSQVPLSEQKSFLRIFRISVLRVRFLSIPGLNEGEKTAISCSDFLRLQRPKTTAIIAALQTQTLNHHRC
jgi:hypothetical protein